MEVPEEGLERLEGKWQRVASWELRWQLKNMSLVIGRFQKSPRTGAEPLFRRLLEALRGACLALQ